MKIIFGNNGNPYHECHPWLVQRRGDGLWIGYHNHLVTDFSSHSEQAALDWLKAAIGLSQSTSPPVSPS